MTSPDPEITLELCTEDVAGAVIAQRAGLNRVEFCAALSEGGLTVSIGAARSMLETVERIDVQFLIRARPGHFVYAREELAAMEADIAAFRALEHADDVRVGFVVGALTAESSVDSDAALRLKAACEDTPVTFHRAFDLVEDQRRALEVLRGFGFDRILTAGGAETALEGAQTLKRLIQDAGDEITILAAGGIRPHNVARVAAQTGARELHLALREVVSEVVSGGHAPSLVGVPVPTDSVARTDENAVLSLASALREGATGSADARA